MKTFVTLGSALVTAIVTLSNPAVAEARKPVDFAFATCLDSIADLSKVDAIAKEKNWIANQEKDPPHGELQIKSKWDVAQDGQRFGVLTGTGKVGGLGMSNVCMIMFNEPNVMAQEFVQQISSSIPLKVMAEMKMPFGRMDMHEIEKNGGKKVVLQFMSKNDGSLIFASVYGAQ